MGNGIARAWRDGDEPLYPVREGRCRGCGQLFIAGQMVQERPRSSLKLFHNDKVDCVQPGTKVPVTPSSGAMAPYVAGSDTSREAALLIGPKAETLRAKVLSYIVRQGFQGATDEEIQQGLGMDASTERPRRIELEDARLIYKTHQKRMTRSGRQAGVYAGTATGIEWATEHIDGAEVGS